ncbi:MAG: ATP-binding protein [Holophagales bacterium]|nr:ATP-binding protein [Holophagales bacterium]
MSKVQSFSMDMDVSFSGGGLRWADRLLPTAILAEDAGDRMRQRLLVAFGILLFALAMPWYGLMLFQDPVWRPPRLIAIAVISTLAANFLWLRWLSARPVTWASLVLTHLAVAANVVMNGGLSGPTALVIPCLPVLTSVLLGTRAGWLDAILVVLAATALEHLAQVTTLPSIAPPEIWSLVRVMSLTIGLVLMLLPVSSHAELSASRARDLAKTLEASEAASRAKSHFLSMMSHELRTPMVGAVGAIELLGRSDLSPESRRLVRALERSVGAQLDLIGNVLDLARVEAGEIHVQRSPVSLRDLVGEIEEMFQISCDAKGVELRAEVDEETPDWISTDGKLVRQILINLVSNALKFTSDGSITVRVGTLPRDGDPGLEVSVADTGIGFEPGQVDRLFEAFHQVDGWTARRFGGSGLGLSIARQLVAAMGGSISASSVPRAGSTFRFEIPAPVAEAPPATRATPPPDEPPTSMNVLLAEDEPINRMVLGAMLEDLGHTVVEAADGRRALELIEESAADLVLLDMHLPELDGPACARAIRSLASPIAEVPIMGLTADAVVENQTRFLASGLDAIESKPIDMERLNQAITRAAALSTARRLGSPAEGRSR